MIALRVFFVDGSPPFDYPRGYGRRLRWERVVPSYALALDLDELRRASMPRGAFS